MHLALYGRTIDHRNISGIKHVFGSFFQKKIQLSIFENYAQLLHEKGILNQGEISTFKKLSDMAQPPDFFISLGGDGTLLSSLPLIYPLEIPVAAINVGRLGYLTTAEVSDLENLVSILFEKKYTLEYRTLVEARINGNLMDEIGFGLNEFTVVKTDTSAMINVETYIDNHFFSNIWADGVVISTPTGSTAYALSCGGPVITPDCPVFVLAAIAPHNLNVRPIVFSDESELRLIVHSRTHRVISSLDSRFVYVSVESEIIVKKSQWKLALVRLKPQGHLDTLRNKLLWGNDMRNFLKFN